MNNASPEQITILTAIIGGVFGSGFLQFIQFVISTFFQRKDKKLEKTDRLGAIQTSIEDINKKLCELENIKAEIKDTKESVIAIGADRIIWTCKRHIKDGYITIREYAELKDLYEKYRDIGGNSDAKTYYEEVCKLPRKAE